MTADDMTQGHCPESADSQSLEGLRSTRSHHRLNQIDRVRANGVGDHISLPQLVVCGDQSAGKSSVLEGITGIPFPRQDGVCTKFATEIILRHNLEVSRITATVIPHVSRSEADKERFRVYRRELQDFLELPDIISEAASLMRIRGHDGVVDGPAFAADVLRIEVVGDTGLHLTVVDLPGLIAVPSDEQTEEDLQLVATLVDNYLESSRTIILAVVQANNDIANQGIIQRARKFDRPGRRTVGIITKADLINKGTEGRIALLAKNQDTTKLKLGYFLLKNPTPAQLDRGISLSERKREERQFFSSAPWREHHLDMSRVGIDTLRAFLQDLLDQHIEKEIPKVREEIRVLLSKTENELLSLGDERPTIAHLRMYLTRLSMTFYSLTRAALDGNYHEADSIFFNTSAVSTTRLRAEVHRLNGEFSAYMRDNGSKRRIGSSSPCPPSSNSNSDSDSDPEDNEQLLVTKEELNAWVLEVYLRTRGRELPGNYNHVLLSELFHEQSSRWGKIAAAHVAKLCAVTDTFVEKALQRIIVEDGVREEVEQLTSTQLEVDRAHAYTELQRILDDERRQPITYNHYYTDNIQNARQDALKKCMQNAMKVMVDVEWNGNLHVSNTPEDSERLFASLQKRVIVVNMDEQACNEAIAGLNAYYRVALKTFVDNVCRQVIERHVLSSLADIFSPTVVMGFSDARLLQVASEPKRQKEHRAALAALAVGLRDSLAQLHK